MRLWLITLSVAEEVQGMDYSNPARTNNSDSASAEV